MANYGKYYIAVHLRLPNVFNSREFFQKRPHPFFKKWQKGMRSGFLRRICGFELLTADFLQQQRKTSEIRRFQRAWSC